MDFHVDCFGDDGFGDGGFDVVEELGDACLVAGLVDEDCCGATARSRA